MTPMPMRPLLWSSIRLRRAAQVGRQSPPPKTRPQGPVNRQEMLREMYAAPSAAEAQRRIGSFFEWCEECDVPEVASLGREIHRWRREVLAYYAACYSNGATEAINLLVEKARRIGHGFRNLKNYRWRLLLYCGGCKWDTHPTARLRGRAPRSVGSSPQNGRRHRSRDYREPMESDRRQTAHALEFGRTFLDEQPS